MAPDGGLEVLFRVDMELDPDPASRAKRRLVSALRSCTLRLLSMGVVGGVTGGRCV